MTATVSYEIHVMRGGRWVTCGVYQDKADAMRDARGQIRKRHLGIRVIEEIFDPERERFVTRTIYRDLSRVEAASATDVPRPGPAGASAMAYEEVLGSGLEPLRTAGVALIGLSMVLLVGIGGLFWFGLV